MREGNNHRPRAIASGVWASKWVLSAIIIGCALVSGLRAQPLPLSHGERIDYDLYFKWGVIMSKAGLATFSVRNASERVGSPWRYTLLFRSSGVVERFFPMRDTIDCHYSADHRLLYSSKRTNDGDYYSVDELDFNYGKDDSVAIHSLRYTLKATKIDTLLMSRNPVFDLLGATMHLRSLDWSALSYGAEFPFTVAIGCDLVNARFRYTGQQIVEHQGFKYRTRHFYIDIYDEAFTQAKEAAEVWMGDDANHIPVKVRAKLRIGAAEAYYRDSFNRQAPLSCRVAIGGGGK